MNAPLAVRRAPAAARIHRPLPTGLVLGLALLLGVQPAAQASPLFGIGDCPGCTPWQDELMSASSHIQPGTGLTALEEQFFTSQAANATYTNDMELFTQDVTDINNVTHNALVMSWAAPVGGSDDDVTVAAWEYVYDVDPDLTGTRIDFSLLFPLGMWDFSLELIDINGNIRGWFVDIMALGLAPNVWHQVALDPSLLAPQGFIPGPIQDPGFDLTQVVAIRLDEAGMNTASFPAPPPGGSIQGQWNAWNHLRVSAVAEPATALLLAFGAAGLLLRAGGARRQG